MDFYLNLTSCLLGLKRVIKVIFPWTYLKIKSEKIRITLKYRESV